MKERWRLGLEGEATLDSELVKSRFAAPLQFHTSSHRQEQEKPDEKSLCQGRGPVVSGSRRSPPLAPFFQGLNRPIETFPQNPFQYPVQRIRRTKV